MVSVLMGILYAFANETNEDREKANKWIKTSGILLGVAIGLIVYLIKINNPKQTNLAIIKFHRIMILVMAVLSLITFILMLVYKKKANKNESKEALGRTTIVLFSLLITSILSFAMPTVFQYTNDFVYFGEDSISSMMLMRVIGFIIGILLCYIIALSSYKLMMFVSEKRRMNMSSTILFITLLGYASKSVTALQRLKWIKFNDFVFKVMIFNDNYGNSFLYASLCVLAILAILIIQDSKHVKGEFANPAMKRKEKAKLLNHTRWAKNTVIQSIVIILVLTVGYYYDNKEVPLTPPQGYQMENGIIIIPLSDVEDGHLHRFEYSTPNGFDVRFIVVKKPQGVAYGVGLDACEICGIAGYFERGDDIVCKRCDVVMNKNTIGFKGGCNPVPFPYEIKDQKIFIDTKDLIAEEMRFR